MFLLTFRLFSKKRKGLFAPSLPPHMRGKQAHKTFFLSDLEHLRAAKMEGSVFLIFSFLVSNIVYFFY